MGRPVKKTVLQDLIMEANIDGSNIDPVSSGALNEEYNSLLNVGQPDFLDYVQGRGNLTTLNTNFGWNSTGMWFSGNAGSNTPCYPIFTSFAIPETSKVTVSWQFPYTTAADLGICVYLDGDVPEWAWGTNTTRIAASFNAAVPAIYGLTTQVAGASVLQNGQNYYAVFTYDPLDTMCVLKTYDAEMNLLDSIQLEIRLASGDYVIGFAADQDNGVPPAVKSYFQNLSIQITPGRDEQIATSSYNVDTYHGYGRVLLVPDDAPDQGEAYMLAYDQNGSSYYVTKLTAHLATLRQKDMVGNFAYEEYSQIAWHFEAAEEDIVQINNA